MNRVFILIIFFVFITGCNKFKKKDVVIVEPPTEIVFADIVTKDYLKRDYIFRLNVSNVRADNFNDRAEQINRVINVFDYSIDHLNTMVKLHDLEPSIFLDNVSRINLEMFLKLAKPRETFVVVDSVKKTIAFLPYFEKGSFLARRNTIGVSSEIRTVLKDVSENGNGDSVINVFPTDAITIPIDITNNIQEPVVDDLSDDIDHRIDVVNVNESIDDVKVLSTKVNQVVVDGVSGIEKDILNNGFVDNTVGEISSDYESKSNEFTAVEKELIEDNIFIKLVTGDTLLECFKNIADAKDMLLVLAMNENEWFLESKINNDYSFNNFDEAIRILLAESNSVLNKNKMNFNLATNIKDDLMEILSE